MISKTVITGGASGIGLAVAAKLLADGGKVCLLDQSDANLVAAQERFGSERVMTATADVRDHAALNLAIRAGAEFMGGLTGCVASAGIGYRVPILESETEDFERVIAINLTGVFHCCRLGLPALQRAGGGAILNMSSLVAVMGAAVPQLAYTASKGGVLAMTREIAVQYGRRNIRANALLPGPIGTPLTAQLFDTEAKLERRRVHMPMGRFGKAVEGAEVALFLCSDAASYVTGSGYLVDGGIHAAYVTPEDEMGGGAAL